MEKDTGGPAFPIPGLQHDADFNGMTLRDYFAARVMQSMWANTELLKCIDGTSEPEVVAIARLSYQQADAMIAERNKQ